MSCLKVNNIYIEQEYAYILEAQECIHFLGYFSFLYIFCRWCTFKCKRYPVVLEKT